MAVGGIVSVGIDVFVGVFEGSDSNSVWVMASDVVEGKDVEKLCAVGVSFS